jgi:hypothetical protein
VLDKAAAPKAIAKRKETFIKIKHQQGQANSQFGTMWINDGTKDRKIPKVENIPLGWNIGRIKWTKKK